MCINKQPLPTDVSDVIYTPIYCINTMDIDDIEGPSPYNLKDIAKCSTIFSEKYTPTVFWGGGGGGVQITHNTQYCQLVPPFIVNKHIHSFGICNPNIPVLLEFRDSRIPSDS